MFGRKNSAEMHTWVEARLSDYADNQLASAERAQLERHLADCAQCQASLASLRWTIALVMQAPVPASQRSFVLPVPARRAPTFAFGFARLATALATLLLVAVIGVDLITQFGGASAPASAPAPKRDAAELAFAPTPTAPAALSAPSALPTAAPKPTLAPPLPAAVPPAPTKAPEPSKGAEALATQPALQDAQKLPSAIPSVRQPVASGAMVTATIPAPTATLAPTQTATAVVPTALLTPTVVAQARAEPTTRAPVAPPATTSQPTATPLRVVEIGLLFLTIFFGVLMVLFRRRQ